VLKVVLSKPVHRNAFCAGREIELVVSSCGEADLCVVTSRYSAMLSR
jgi:hypothetical protein